MYNSNLDLLPTLIFHFDYDDPINEDLYDKLKEEISEIIDKNNFTIIEIQRGSAIPKIALIGDLAKKGIKASKQKEISNEINSKLIGKKITSIVETIQSDGLTIGRTYKDAPDVDGLVYIETDKVLTPGDIYDVKITSYSDYDLYGKI